jgi:hypothetical protein
MAEGSNRWALKASDSVTGFWCAVCDHEVERVERDVSQLRQAESWTLHCHGETEEFEVDDAFWQMFGSGAQLELLDAFVPRRPRRIPEPPEILDLSAYTPNPQQALPRAARSGRQISPSRAARASSEAPGRDPENSD